MAIFSAQKLLNFIFSEIANDRCGADTKRVKIGRREVLKILRQFKRFEKISIS